VSQPVDDSEFEISASGTRDEGFQRLANIFAAIGTLWIFFLMLLIVADVVGRNFLDRPITGVAEFAGRSVVAIVFLQLAAAIGSGRMTRSDFLISRVARRQPSLAKALEVLFALTGAFLFAALAVISWPELVAAWRGSEYFGVQGVYMIPLWPFRGLLVIGSALASVAYLVLLPKLLKAELDGKGVSS